MRQTEDFSYLAGAKLSSTCVGKAGVYGYPKDQALQVAEDAICEFLKGNDMTVYIVIFDRKT